MKRIERSDGVRLMRLWGLPGWPDIEADYRLWNGCCVFAILPLEDGKQVHMAMRKDSRRRCREAATDVIRLCDSTVYAPIINRNKSIRNMLIKLGFRHLSDEDGNISVYEKRV